MENIQLNSKNLFTGNIYQNNNTWINILDETEFLNKVGNKNRSGPIILSSPCRYRKKILPYIQYN